MKGRMIPRVATLLVLAFLAAGTVAQQPPPVSAADGEAVFVLVLQPQRAGEAPFDVARFGGTLHYRSGPRLAVTLPESAVDGLRHNPQVRYIQRMVIGPPPVTAAENAQPAWPEAVAPPPPPSAFRVSGSATTSWTTGSYTYDGSGNISGIGPGTDLQTNAYVYDRIGRLSSARVYNGTRKHEESYVHDPAGNLTQLTKDSVTLSFPVDPATNRLAASLAAYDAVGNTTWMAGAGAYTYDQLGMIASNDVDAYIYTADDERLAVGRMPEDPTWRWTLRDLNGRVVREFESFGPQKTSQYFVWVEDHFFGDGVLVASEREVAEGGRRHFHVDHLGTPRMVTDVGGNRVSAHVYAPYGRELTSVQQERARGFSREQPLRFTGHERDGLNDLSNEEHTKYLDYMHARFYNPNWGRFLSVDPVMDVKSNVSSPQGWNRYAYARNNPVLRVDPDGRKDKVFVVAALEAKYTMPMQRMLNAELKGTPYAGRVEVIGPSASRGQMLLTLRNADSSDIVIIASHGGRSADAARGGNIGTLFNGQGQITSGATMAQWANDGSAPKAVILAGCCTNQTAQTITNTAGSETLGTNQRTINGENQPGAVAATGVLARGGTIQDAAAAANQHIKTDGNCGRNPGCDASQPARFEANPPR